MFYQKNVLKHKLVKNVHDNEVNQRLHHIPCHDGVSIGHIEQKDRQIQVTKKPGP